MNVRNIALSLLAAAAIFTAPAAAMAQPADHPAPHGKPPHAMRCERPAKPCLNAEQAKQMKELRAAHHAAIAPLRDKIMQKRMELRALSPNPNVKPEELKAIVGEIMSLRKQMRDLKDEFRTKMEKSGLPFAMEYGPRGKHFKHGFHPKKDCGPHGWHDDCRPCGPRHEKPHGCPAAR